MNEFFNILKNIRTNQIIINEKNYNRIWKADKTAIWLDLIKGNSIEKIGNEKVNVHTFGNEKLRVSIMLCVSAMGNKLPPLLTSKGKEGKAIEKKYSKNKNILSKKVFLKCQENSWLSIDLFNFWLNNIFFTESIYKNLKGNILIFDRATCHFTESINTLFDKYSSNYVLIPPGQTRFLQPLDIGVNKVFKENIYKKNNDFNLSTALEEKLLLII